MDKNKEKIGAMFDSIAHRYDFLNHFLSAGIDRRWRNICVSRLSKDNPTKILDVATGTADLAIAIAKGNTRSIITGIDLSEGMLSVGRSKVTALNLQQRIDLIAGDALDMPFEDDSFDAVTVSFGVRNFEDLKKGLTQMYRVLKPGGKLFVIELSVPRNRLIASAYKLYFTKLLPTIGRYTSKDDFAYKYLPESVIEFPSGDKFAEILRCSGYSKIEITPLNGGIATLYEAAK